MHQHRQTYTIDVHGGPFYVEAAGHGLPVVLLHAGIADSRMWDPQIDALSPSYHVLRCDLPGYGRSPVPDTTFSYHEYVVELLNERSIESAWLVGASFGGRIAVDVCLAHPERVRGLVLVAPLVGGYEPDEQLLAFDAEEDRLLNADDVAGATDLNVRTWVVGPYREADEVPTAIRSLVAEMQRRAFDVPVPENATVDFLAPPAIDRLHEIRTPTLILVGALDLPEVVAFSETLAVRIPDAARVVMPDVAHLPSLEAPHQFNQHVVAFIEEAESRA